MATAPVLDLATLLDPIRVRIDGTLYALHRPDALSLSQVARVDALRPDFEALRSSSASFTLTLDQLKTLESVLAEMCLVVLDAPADVQARLSDPQRIAIIQAFTQLPPPRQTAGAVPLAPKSTGARSSRGSRASTAARRRTG